MTGHGKERTSGWPRESTPGACREWQLTISTSGGRYFSNAAISGALQDVWPPTIAFVLVAIDGRGQRKEADERELGALHGPYVATI